MLETLAQVKHDEPLPPSRLLPGLPHNLETVCLKCLRKEPRHRYADAAALADDMRRFLDGEPIRARPVSPLERLGRWCLLREPKVACLLAVLAMIIAGGFSLVFWQWRRAEWEAAVARSERNTARREWGTAEANFQRARDAVGRLTELGQGLADLPRMDRI